MKKMLVPAVAALFLFSGVSLCARAGDDRDITTPGDHVRSLEFDGRDRNYIVHVPDGYTGKEPVPLVVALHGGGGNAANMKNKTGFAAVADDNGFIVVYPNGTGKRKNFLLTWNAGSCCAYAVENDIDDVGFIRAIVQELEAELNVDPKRVYATGHSNGAMMAYRLACEAADIFAAIGPVAGIISVDECKPTAPVGIVDLHGTDDRNVPYEGGVGARAIVKEDRKPVADSINFWTLNNKCSELDHWEEGNLVIDRHHGCENGTEVLFYTIIDGGHSWPGGAESALLGDQPSQDIDASTAVWEFFAGQGR